MQIRRILVLAVGQEVIVGGACFSDRQLSEQRTHKAEPLSLIITTTIIAITIVVTTMLMLLLQLLI